MTDQYQADSHGAPNDSQIHRDHESAPEHPPVSGRKASVTLILAAIVVAALAIFGILKRHRN